MAEEKPEAAIKEEPPKSELIEDGEKI